VKADDSLVANLWTPHAYISCCTNNAFDTLRSRAGRGGRRPGRVVCHHGRQWKGEAMAAGEGGVLDTDTMAGRDGWIPLRVREYALKRGRMAVIDGRRTAHGRPKKDHARAER
jgi:hypothetical protein